MKKYLLKILIRLFSSVSTLKKRGIFVFIGWILAIFILAVSVSMFDDVPRVVEANTNLLVSAASSLQNSLQDIKPLYEQTDEPTKANVNINYNFGSSGALQQQIEQGAPADIFFSAATKQMDALQEKGLILTETRQNLLTNCMVLIVPINSSLGINSFQNLTASSIRRIAIGEPRSVPAGEYAEEILRNLRIWDKMRSKLVFGNNVRQVLAFVESGNADAGIVYATDAKISNQVNVVATAPENLHSPIVYPIAVLKNSKNVPLSRDYLQFLSSNTARAVFERYGFRMARS